MPEWPQQQSLLGSNRVASDCPGRVWEQPERERYQRSDEMSNNEYIMLTIVHGAEKVSQLTPLHNTFPKKLCGNIGTDCGPRPTGTPQLRQCE